MFFIHMPIADIIKKFVCYDKAFVAKYPSLQKFEIFIFRMYTKNDIQIR